MGYSGNYFLNKNYFIPGSRGVFRAKPQPTGTSVDINTLVLISDATNGFDCNDDTLTYDQRVMQFGSFEEAKQILKSGTALDCIKAAFSPSKDSRFSAGPSVVKLLQINPNEKASGTFNNQASGTHTIDAYIPGPSGNSIRVKVYSVDKIAIGDETEIVTRENLDVTDMTIQYTGDATTATLTFNGTTLTSALTGQTDGTANLSILISQFPTLGDLINKINATLGYTALLKTQPDIKAEVLDYFTSSNIKGVDLEIKSTFTRQKTFLESTGLITITMGASKSPFSATTNFVYLSGGSTGTFTDDDYIDAIEFSKKVSGLYRNITTTTLSINKKLAEVVAYMNSPQGSNETYGGGGSAIDTLTYAERIDQGKSINSEFMCYGVSPITARQSDGLTKKTYDGWYLALLHNAVKASANPRESATYKDLNIEDCPESHLYTDLQKEKFIQAGCLFVDRKPNNGAFKINFGLTTYQKSNKILNMSQTVTTALALVKDLRESLDERFLGETPTDPSAYDGSFTDADIRVFVDNKFNNDYIKKFGWLTSNIYTGEPAFDPAYTITREGDAIYFNFPNANVVSALNFFFFLLNIDLVKGSSTGV